MKKFSLLLGFVAAWLAASFAASAAELTVHAAASLTDVLKELAPSYEKQSGDKLFFNFGASSQLARQIEEGAPADVFFSADEAQMDKLEKAGLLAAGTRAPLVGNVLVIVVPADSALAIDSPADLTKPEVKKIAVAEPNSVPVGVYTKQYFTRLGLWEIIAPKLVVTENVRASLAAVESGNVEAGTVYRTDALISKKVRVVYEALDADKPRIIYPLAALKNSRDPAAARRLLMFLESDEARDVFERYGFLARK